MEDGGGGMVEVREQVVTKLKRMVKVVMRFQERMLVMGRIAMMMIGIQMMMVTVIMITGGWGGKMTSEEAVAVQQRVGAPPLSG